MSDPFTPRPMVGANGYQASPPTQRNNSGRRGRSNKKSKSNGGIRRAQGTKGSRMKKNTNHVPPAERFNKKVKKQSVSMMPPSQETQMRMQRQQEKQRVQQMEMQRQQYEQQQVMAQQQEQQQYQQMMMQQQQMQQQQQQQQQRQQYMQQQQLQQQQQPFMQQQPPPQQQFAQQRIQQQANQLYTSKQNFGQADPNQNPLQWTISALESDPYFEPSRVPNFITFWLVILSQSFEISVRQAADLMDPNDHKIGNALQKGVQGAFGPVRRLCQTLYHNCGKMAHLLQTQDDMLRPLLITLQAGIGSDDAEVSGACCRCLRNLSKHLMSHHHQHILWLWFTADGGGLDALVQASLVNKNQSVRKSVLMLIAQLCTTEDRASALLRKHLHEKVPVAADYMQLTHDIVIELERAQMQSGQNATLLSLETVRHIVNYSFRHAQSRAGNRPQPKRRDPEVEKREAAAQQAYNRGRCAALCLLSDLWLLMDRRFQMGANEETVMKAILGLIKKAARDRRAVDVQITANTCLFDLLDVFVRGQRPYAPFVYKTLIFSLIESKQDDISLREYMLSTMLQSLRSLPHLPVAVLIEPLIKQASMNGYTLSEIELLGASTAHERLSPKHALALLDMLGKIVLDNLLFTEVAFQPMLVCIKRFANLVQVQNFVVAFIKFALDVLMQSESKMAAALDTSNSGVLEYHDVDEGMEHALRRIFYDLDVNNNNVVEKRELLRALRDGLPSLYRAVESFPRLKPILKPSSYDQTFLLMSTSQEGVITYDEFKAFCVKISRQGGERDFGNNDDTSNLTDSQMKRKVILSTLRRIVDLRNRKINSNSEPVFSAAQEKFTQMNVTMTNFQNSKSPSGRYLDENAVANMEEVTNALDEILGICRATTPPSQQNLSESVNAMMETQEDTAWKGASIDDLDSSYINAKKGGNVVPEPAEVVDKERPETPPDPDIVVLAKMLKQFHSVLTFRRPSLKSMKEGTMDYNEFKRQIYLCLGIKMKTKEARMTFDWFDKDGGGDLDGAEVLKAFFDTKPMENFVNEVTKRFPIEMARKKRKKKKKGPRRGPGPKATPPGGKSRWENPLLKSGLAKIQDALTLRRPNLDVFKGKTLSREDFKRDLMHALSLKMSEDEVNAVFDYYDDDQSGELDYVEIIRRFFDKKETGKINNAPTILSHYQGEVGRTRDFDEDSEHSDFEDEMDENIQIQIERALPQDLRGDGFTAVTLRKIKAALDAGGADPDLEDDMRAFKGRNLTKKQFKKQCKKVLGLDLTQDELDCCFDYFDEDGGGTVEYDELIRGLHGPLHSALTRMKQVLDEDRMTRDMSSFKGRDLSKEDFWYQTKVVLGVTLSKDELDAVFDYFDEDGGGSIDYGEILYKFHRREHLDLTMAGKTKRRTYRSGIEFRKVNIDRVRRRREKELERKRIREQRRKMRSARIRKALREQFEEKLENRIALGVRQPRTSIAKRQDNLIQLHETQVKGKRESTRTMFEKSMKDVQMSRVKARPPTPPNRPTVYLKAEELLKHWIVTLKAVFSTYVKYQLSFKRTQRYDFDALTKTKGTIDETNWLRCLTDFRIVPNLMSKYDAKGIFVKSNLTLSPNRADTSIVVQNRPIGMKGPEQFRLCNFEDFLTAVVGVAHSRASFFACHSTSQEKCDALMAFMRDASIKCNNTKEILKYYNKKKVVSGSVDIGNFLSHGNDAPSYIWRLRRVFGDERAENTQWNAWLHLSTPTFYYEWRLSDCLRANLGEARWIAIEILDEVLNGAVNNLHILQSMKVDTYHEEEKNTISEKILPKLLKKKNIEDPTDEDISFFTGKARKIYAKKTNRPYRVYKGIKPLESIPTVPTVDGRAWVPPSVRLENVKVPEHVERLHIDVKHDLLKEMSSEKIAKLDTIERTKAKRSHNSGIGFGSAAYMDNRAPMSEQAMEKWNSHATMRKQFFNRDARVDRLAFLGEKSRAEMTMGRQVTARWATEIIVRIADECTTGEARERIEEKCDYDDKQEIPLKKWVAKYTLSRRKGEHLVGLPRYAKNHPMATLIAPPVPNLRPKETEKAVDRKLRNDVIAKKKALLRERRRRRRQLELAEKLEEAKREKKAQEVARIAEEAEKNSAAKARKIAEQEAKKQTQEATRLEIEAWKVKREQRRKAEMRNREYVEDVSGRYYSMRVRNQRKHVETIEEKSYKAKRVSPRSKHIKPDDTTDFDIEELNRRRKEAKEKRQRAVRAMEKAKAKERAEFEALEEKLRLANNPLDKVSLKLTMALKKNHGKLSEIFAKIDTDGSGSVTYKEFRRGLFQVGIKLSTKETHELCTGLDKDGDGDVSYLELKRFMDNSVNNTHAAAASIQARWRAKRVNMKTKAELKEEYRQKQLKDQTMRLKKKSQDWKRELETDLVVDEEEFDARGRRVKKNNRKKSVFHQKNSPRGSPKNSLSDSQRSNKSLNNSQSNNSNINTSSSNSTINSDEGKSDIVKWDSNGNNNDNNNSIDANHLTNWNAENQ